MKKISKLLSAILLITLLQACKKRCDDCYSYRECIKGECVLKEDCYELAGTGICWDNIYFGVVKGNSCLDTIIFSGNPSNPGSEEMAFPYFEKQGQYVPFRTLLVTKTLGENEFLMGDITPICGSSQGYWYFSKVHCKIHPDSVNMNIFFQATSRTIDEPFIDSCKVTLYKKAFLPQ